MTNFSILEEQWERNEQLIRELEDEDNKLLMNTNWGGGWKETEKALNRGASIKEQLKVLVAAQEEIEEFLIEWQAPGWVST